MKKIQFLFSIFFVVLGCFSFSDYVLGDALSWVQDDWSGGSGQSTWSDSTKYNSSTNISNTASGISLATKSNWYNSSWKYRQSISITNNSGATLTNYQVPIYINTSSLIAGVKMKNDCSDIRIVDATGTVLPLWTVSAPSANICNTASTKVWVKLSSLPSSGTTLYVYYGNSGASSVSNGNEVFSVFGDFTSGSSLPSGWVKTDVGTSGTASVGSGVLSISNTNGEDVWMRIYGATHVYKNSTFNGSFVAEALLNSQTNSDPWAKTGITVQNAVSSGVGNGQAFIVATPGNGMAFQYQSEAGEVCVGGDCTAPNSQVNSGTASLPVFLKLTKNNSNQVSGYYSANGSSWTQRGSTAAPWGVTAAQYITLFVTPHDVADTGVATYSFFYVRSFSSSEPTVGSPQNEEATYESSGSLISSVYDTQNVVDYGTITYSILSDANTTVAVRVRTSDNADMSGADDFATCDLVSSGDDISNNNCVTDRQRYIQYQVELSSSNSLSTPSLQDLTIGYSLTPVYTLSYSVTGSGSISGSATQSVYSGNDGSAVTAVAGSAYQFTRWSDGSTTNPRTDKNVLANLSVSAVFTARGSGGAPVCTPPTVIVPPALSHNSVNFNVANVYQMAISETDNFALSSWEPYSEAYKANGKKLYIKFRSPNGGETKVYEINPVPVEVEKSSAESNPATVVSNDVETKASEIKTTAKYSFTRNLKLGMQGQDVLELQKLLNSFGFLVAVSGSGSIGHETAYFGNATKQALIKFQTSKNLPAFGYFGTMTRNLVN